MEQDIELICRIRDGDKEALKKLIKKYDRKLYNFIYKIVREENSSKDILQDTFIKLIKNIESFDRDKNFVTWLFTIAKNNAYNFLKQNKRYQFIELSPAVQVISTSSDFTSPESVYEEKENNLKLIKSIEALPEKYKRLIYLKYDLGMSYQEISIELSIPVHKVESRLYMARQKLLRHIQLEEKFERGVSK